MSDTKDKKPLSLSGSSKLEMKRPGDAAGQVRQSFSHGRSKTVTVEVKKKRGAGAPRKQTLTEAAAERVTPDAKVAPAPAPVPAAPPAEPADKDNKGRVVLKALTDDEKATRARALEGSKIASVEARKKAQEDASRRVDEEARLAVEREAAEKREAAEAERLRAEEEAAAAAPVDKELPELPPLDGSAPLPPVQEASGINIPVVLAATGGALGLCAAAFFFIL